jgi:hypothetical protein
MGLKFNIDRPKVSDEEIKKHQDFNNLVRQFKEQSIKKARGDESWWRNKKVQYTAVIAGITVVCTVTYLSLFQNQQTKQTVTNDKITTSPTSSSKPTQKPNAAAKPTKAFVAAPSQKLKTPYSRYKVNNAKGGAITHSTSTTIKVPKNSFVDKQGRDVIGDVTIEYREFHDLGDIVLSGIPMKYDSAGRPFNLESAGMFDIKGTQNGEPVFIKKDKPLKVELASTVKDDRFNQYYLDTVKGNWTYLKRDDLPKRKAASAVSKEDLDIQTNSLSSKKIQDLEYTSEKVIPRKVDSLKVSYTQRIAKLPVASKPFPPAKATQGRATFKLDGSYDEFPELAAFDNVVFEVGPENRNYTRDMHEITWSDVKISQGPVKGKNYILTLIYRQRTEKLIVYPVLSGSDFEEASEDYSDRLEKYNDLTEKRAANEKRLLAEMEKKQQIYLAEQSKLREEAAKERLRLQEESRTVATAQLAGNFKNLSNQAKTSRLFDIGRFGIYNSDCPHSRPSGEPLNPVFVTSEKAVPVSAEIIYLIDHSKKTVYQFSGAEQQNIRIAGGNQYSVCLFRNQALFICDRKSFSESLSNNNKKFIVKKLDDEAGLVDFKKALEI